MHRAWLLMLTGCGLGFQATPVGDSDAGNTQSPPPTDGGTSSPASICWTFVDTGFAVNWETCPTKTVPDIDVDIGSDVTINTDSGTSSDPNVTCVPADTIAKLDQGKIETDKICAIVARTITIEAGHTLSATGSRTLALFAHTINIQGIVDVASHRQGAHGPGSASVGCAAGTPPSDNIFGGNGGYFGTNGGLGGNEPANAVGSTTGTTVVRSGCDGMPAHGVSLDGKTAGAGGGSVWIASDMGQFTLGDSAAINASGAGGLGGDTGHGGSGGGSGGLIVLQSSTITISATSNAQIFANGGGGGGGGSKMNVGTSGDDAGAASSGGASGAGGTGDGTGGSGGAGYDATVNPNAAGGAGLSSTTGSGGGGGGGGGAGIIRTDTSSSIQQVHFSPPPTRAHH
jgi:hypothetical protein